MASRESISTFLTLLKGAGNTIGSHLSQRQTQLCDFYKGSILTKQLRVHDEMWEELQQLSQESKVNELKTYTSSTKSANDLGKRYYSTKAHRSLKTTENRNVSYN